MSKQQLTVIPAAIAKHVERIKDYDAGLTKSFEQMREYAYLLGAEMLALKETVGHGNKDGEDGFMEAREKYLPWISRSKAQRLMAYVEDLELKLPTVGNIRPVALLEGKLPEEARKQVDDLARQMDSKSWTGFARDLGEIRQPEKQKYNPPKQTPEEKEAAADALADDFFNILCGHFRQIIHDFTEYKAEKSKILPDIVRIKAKRRAEFERLRIDVGKIVKALSKKPRKGGRQ